MMDTLKRAYQYRRESLRLLLLFVFLESNFNIDETIAPQETTSPKETRRNFTGCVDTGGMSPHASSKRTLISLRTHTHTHTARQRALRFRHLHSSAFTRMVSRREIGIRLESGKNGWNKKLLSRRKALPPFPRPFSRPAPSRRLLEKSEWRATLFAQQNYLSYFNGQFLISWKMERPLYTRWK